VGARGSRVEPRCDPVAMRLASIVLCVIAATAMGTVVRDMIVGADSGRRGWVLRAIAAVAFLLAVLLNVA
jgi:hypothetical protein